MLNIGIDLGGTNIAAGIVDENGKILRKGSVPTGKERPTEEVVKDIASLCFSLLEQEDITLDDIAKIGMGCPGTVDNENGIIAYSNNIRMENVPMREMLSSYFPGKTINLENDANAAAYGEYAVNGGGAKSFVFITLGTGVGGGIIIDGKIYRGFNGAGAELGHIIIQPDGEQCTCGIKGCWEAYASVTALIRQTKAAMEKDPNSMMHEWVADYGKISGRTAFECARKGDSAAIEVVENYVRYISIGLINILNIFQPEKILIGGGISKEGDYLFEPVKKIVYKYDYNKYMPKTQIGAASLFNDAGIIGAALA